MDEKLIMYWLTAILVLPYSYLILKIFRRLQKAETYSVPEEPKTFVSVIVPCHNEENHLPHILESISRQNYPADLFEIIIVDDNSSDRTYHTASAYSTSINVLTVYNNGSGKKQAIRTGVSAASGKLIITTDADCLMGNNWIRTIASFYENHKPDMIISPVQIKSTPGFFGRFQELEFLSLQGITAGTALSGDGLMCNGANLSFTAEAYLKHSDNLHDEIPSGDDIFLLHSFKRAGDSKILWLESMDSLVTTNSVRTAGAFLKQRTRWLSKAKSYTDTSTLVLGIVTFVTILVQIFLLASVFIKPEVLPQLIVVLLLKLIPDYLILMNCSRRYDRRALLNWFLPSQLIYPFYVITVAIYSLRSEHKKSISSPFPKETLF
jgi:glycosyltransferase involved in cell wall biosynthesis